MGAAGRLAGKVAVVTGTGSGIGRGCALMFAAQGASVVGCDIDATAGERFCADAAAAGVGANVDSVHPVDLTTLDGARSLVAHALTRHGRIDILVNAAATAVFAPIEQLTLDDWRMTLAAELDSVFLVTQAAWPHLVASGHGSIINFASANAHVALDGSPALAHCAGKGGILAMTRQLAMEGGPHNLRANTISPGLILTGATIPALETRPGMREHVLAKKMIKRLGQPEDVAYLATFLASDESSWITGADYAIDGGATAW